MAEPSTDAQVIDAINGLGKRLDSAVATMQRQIAVMESKQATDHAAVSDHEARIRELQERTNFADQLTSIKEQITHLRSDVVESMRGMDTRVTQLDATAVDHAQRLGAIEVRVETITPAKAPLVAWLALVGTVAGLLLTVLINTVDIH